MPMGRHANARGFSRKHVMEGIDASLDRLGTDYVDLYQTHIWDPSTDLEELVDAFGEVVRAGKARYIGVTTLPAWVLAKTRRIADEARSARFISMQCEYNLCHPGGGTRAGPAVHGRGDGDDSLQPVRPRLPVRGPARAGEPDGTHRD